MKENKFEKQNSFEKGLLEALRTLNVNEFLEISLKTRSYAANLVCKWNFSDAPKYKVKKIQTITNGLIEPKVIVIRVK